MYDFTIFYVLYGESFEGHILADVLDLKILFDSLYEQHPCDLFNIEILSIDFNFVEE